MFCESLPSWECGLKQDRKEAAIAIAESLPSWECGLKRRRRQPKRRHGRHSPRGSVD